MLFAELVPWFILKSLVKITNLSHFNIKAINNRELWHSSLKVRTLFLVKSKMDLHYSHSEWECVFVCCRAEQPPVPRNMNSVESCQPGSSGRTQSGRLLDNTESIPSENTYTRSHTLMQVPFYYSFLIDTATFKNTPWRAHGSVNLTLETLEDLTRPLPLYDTLSRKNKDNICFLYNSRKRRMSAFMSFEIYIYYIYIYI